MSDQRTRRNYLPVIWLGLSALGFGAAVALGYGALALLGSFAILGTLLSVDHVPRIPD